MGFCHGVCSSGSHLLTAGDGGSASLVFVASCEPETLPSTAVSKWEPLEHTHGLQVLLVKLE